MTNNIKYPNGTQRVEHVMDRKLFNKLLKRLQKLFPKAESSQVTRTDLINSMITECLKKSDKSIIKSVKLYKDGNNDLYI